MKPVVRAAGPETAAVIAAVLSACLEPAWSAESIASFLVSPGSFALLVWDAEAADGEEIASPLGFILCQAAAGTCDVAAMGVAPQRRRKGLGRALLSAACAEAAKRGARQMFLEVAETNAPARALYLSQGFGEVGRRLRYYAGGTPRKDPVDALLLRRDL
ncbi:MAG TPA: GNAT family N-acetyltransferase [Alphaproteobacteria bacterium]|nr:GNAT family N-acetyltransferase [Alphaproteobacteria bacterium]